MAILKAKARQTTTVTRGSEGQEVYIKALRDGTLTVADWIAAMSLEGRVFTANIGTGTTAVTYGAGTLDTTEHDMHVAVPSSVVIIPLSLRIHFDVYASAGIVECCLQSGSGSAIGTATATITPQSSNRNAGLTSACVISSACATGTALTTNIKEIWRDGVQLAITIATVGQVRNPEIFTWEAKRSGVLDVVGPSQQLVVFASANAGTGAICLKYAELPVAAIE